MDTILDYNDLMKAMARMKKIMNKPFYDFIMMHPDDIEENPDIVEKISKVGITIKKNKLLSKGDAILVDTSNTNTFKFWHRNVDWKEKFADLEDEEENNGQPKH